jgi:hypothetical protein
MHVQVVNANGVLVIGDNQYFDVVISSGAYARTVRLRHGGSAEIVIPGGEYAVSVGESDLGARYEYLALIGPDGLIGDGVPLDLSGRGSANVTAVIKVAGVPTALAGKLIVTKQVFCDGELLPPDPAQTFRVTAYGIVADAKDNISTFSDFADVPQGGSHTFDTGRGSIDVMEPRAAADTGFELAGMFNLSAWAAGPSLGSTNEIASVGRTRGAGVLIFNTATPRAAPPPPSDGPADGDPGGVPETGYPAIGGDGDGTASRPPSYGSPADSIPTAVDTAKAATEPEEPETQVAEAAEAAAEASVGDERIRDIRVPRGSAASSGESLPVAALTQNRVAYINGYQDGTVGPDNIVTRAEAAAMMFRLLSESSKSGLARSRFPDVPDSAWYAESVNCLAAVGVVAGYEDNRFKPDLPVTRAEFVTIISRFAEPDAGSLAANPPGLPGAKFSDVVGHWAENQIMKACARGWVNGYDGGEFKPQAGVTRAEAVTIMNRVLGRHSYGLPAADAISPFADILPTHWAFAAIVEAAAVA